MQPELQTHCHGNIISGFDFNFQSPTASLTSFMFFLLKRRSGGKLLHLVASHTRSQIPQLCMAVCASHSQILPHGEWCLCSAVRCAPTAGRPQGPPAIALFEQHTQVPLFDIHRWRHTATGQVGFQPGRSVTASLWLQQGLFSQSLYVDGNTRCDKTHCSLENKVIKSKFL